MHCKKKLGSEEILGEFGETLQLISEKISGIAQALQEGKDADAGTGLDNTFFVLESRYEEQRHLLMNASNAEAFIALRHVLSGIKDLVAKVQNLAVLTTYDKKLKLKRQVDYDRFVVPSYINFSLLQSNLNWQSNIFRYSVRMAVAVVAGYLLSLLFPIGHSYWILLTIVVILKPAYALTRKRNTERLLGTLVGGILGVIILFLIKNALVLLILLILFMVGAFSLMRTRYWVSVGLLTAYVLISIYLLKPGDYTPVFKDRLLDTFIGSVISFLFTRFIPPVWEKVQLKDLIAEAIRSNRDFLIYILDVMAGAPINISQYKWYRKETYVALANVSDAFQRMLNEPKSRQEQGAHFHPLIVGCHVLSSRTAALGRIVQKLQFTGSLQQVEAYKLLVSNILSTAESKLLIDGDPGFGKPQNINTQSENEILEELLISWNNNPAFRDSLITPTILKSHVGGISALALELRRLALKVANKEN